MLDRPHEDLDVTADHSGQGSIDLRGEPAHFRRSQIERDIPGCQMRHRLPGASIAKDIQEGFPVQALPTDHHGTDERDMPHDGVDLPRVIMSAR